MSSIISRPLYPSGIWVLHGPVKWTHKDKHCSCVYEVINNTWFYSIEHSVRCIMARQPQSLSGIQLSEARPCLMLKDAPWWVVLIPASCAAVQATPERKCGVNRSRKEQGGLVGAPVGSGDVSWSKTTDMLICCRLLGLKPISLLFSLSLSLCLSLFITISGSPSLSLHLPLSLPLSLSVLLLVLPISSL